MMVDTIKDSNPKDAIGVLKVGLSNIPLGPLLELAVAMTEGSMKYGRHNYRAIGVRSSVYFDALIRHMFAWWEGEDIDTDSGLSHLVKAMACLAVLRDAQINGKCYDDRPPKSPETVALIKKMDNAVKKLAEKYPDPKQPYTEERMSRTHTGEVVDSGEMNKKQPGPDDMSIRMQHQKAEPTSCDVEALRIANQWKDVS
jgi:hypothetical protein